MTAVPRRTPTPTTATPQRAQPHRRLSDHGRPTTQTRRRQADATNRIHDSRQPRIVIDVNGPGVVCDACGQPIAPGTRAAIHSSAPVIVHDDSCPARWTPRVVDGGASPSASAYTYAATPRCSTSWSEEAGESGPNRTRHPDMSPTTLARLQRHWSSPIREWGNVGERLASLEIKLDIAETFFIAGQIVGEIDRLTGVGDRLAAATTSSPV